MSKQEIYFDNHSKASRFPWSLYHKPLLDDLREFLGSKINLGSKVLVIGPGDFHEFSFLKSLGAEISLLDIDPRVLEVHKRRHDKDVANFYLVDENFNGYPAETSFDVIYAKEVIEHIVDYPAFLTKIKSALVPFGFCWLSTPNYGFFLLPFLERTVLEIIARISGFSRKNIHPSRFSEPLLKKALEEAGFEKIKTTVTPLKLALVAVGKNKAV